MSSSETIVTTTTTTFATASITTIAPSLEIIALAFADTFTKYLDYLGKIPGGLILLRYIKSSYKNDPIRSLFEFALFLFGLKYFLSSKRKENKSDILEFTKPEEDNLIKEWEPEPLIEPVTSIERWQNKSIPQIKGHNRSHIFLVDLSVDANQVLNMASFDFLNLNDDESMRSVAKGCISTDGVGACGPPNFYGTQDVHVRLEEDLARYLDAEQAIIYGQDFVTSGSVIPSFLKRGDLCVVDSNVNLAIQKALIVSRCDIEFFDHNDMKHLKSLLKELKPVLDKQKPIRKRFIVTEGLFAESGDIANLPELVKLKNEYKYRLFVDESFSIGTLGKTGKGVCEHFDIPRSEIGITIGSMSHSFASSGGFCVGVKPMIHHQRISSIAYVFSASLPPYSARTSSEAISQISKNLDSDGKSLLISNLHNKVASAYRKLTEQMSKSFVEIISDPQSPILILSFASDYRKRLGLPPFYGNTKFILTGKHSTKLNPFDAQYNIESFILQKIIDQCLLKANVLFTRSKNILQHENLPVIRPRLLIMINNGISVEEIETAVFALKDAIRDVCSKINTEEDFYLLEKELVGY